ncbi:hypothetical protein VC83_07585 [Pseudogymnoascus destructans]|uniref:Myb-like domain-containing protein n=1 Tax=Pseudogymnoascus destructans TaxID=655981 RepID=A0A177A2Y9_9PEZI|nr:uncharacterized protein VC83_07585 [Pseudogymnoascus destructans]OAF55631.1 hypothetical protein VC83_07585 [Pseudogymnoascus destructans]
MPHGVTELYQKVMEAGNIQDIMSVANFLNPVDEDDNGEDEQNVGEDEVLQEVLQEHLGLPTTQSDEEDVISFHSLSSSRSDADGFGDGDPNTGSDGDAYSSEDNVARSDDRKYSEWSPLDKQRLSAYKKEGKSWEWIFSKFPGRTKGAVRTRWSTMQSRVK